MKRNTFGDQLEPITINLVKPVIRKFHEARDQYII